MILWDRVAQTARGQYSRLGPKKWQIPEYRLVNARVYIVLRYDETRADVAASARLPVRRAAPRQRGPRRAAGAGRAGFLDGTGFGRSGARANVGLSGRTGRSNEPSPGLARVRGNFGYIRLRLTSARSKVKKR